MKSIRPLIVVAALICLLSGACAAATDGDWADLSFHPHPGAQLPLTASLTDEQGREVALGQYFTGKPVILVLEYLRCRTLCGVTLQDVVTALDRMPLEAGRDFQLLAVSIDGRDTPADAAAAKTKFAALYHDRGAEDGFHFLTGPSGVVQRIAAAVGFPYRYDAALDQYIHPAGFVVAMPDGRISRYILGVGVTPQQLTDALADAEQNKAVGPLTRLLLLCHIAGSPLDGYTMPVVAAFTLADLVAMVALVAVFAAIGRRRHG